MENCCKQNFKISLKNIKNEIKKLESSKSDSLDRLLKLKIIENRLINYGLWLCDKMETLNRDLKEAEVFSEEITKMVDGVKEIIVKIKMERML